jgi:serine protease AprX
VARLKHDPAVHVYEDRGVRTTGLLSFLDPALKSTINSTNATVGGSAVGSVTTTTMTQVLQPVLSTDLTRSLTSPIVSGISSSASLQDGRGVGALGLTYETNYPHLIDADALQDAGVNGAGVTIAMLDTGLWQDTTQNYGGRVLASIDVVGGGTGTVKGDPYGHGTHVTSVAASGAINLAGRYQGIAPRANLVVVRAFNGDGAARYSDVIAGLNWVVANKGRYNIRVLNLSFGAPPQSFYWEDPLNQAVMAAWRAGIVVVTASGNDGPVPMTVNVPGNVPYVITVGALTDNYTPYVGGDDRLASFSSTGPTYEGFVKPEIVAPGGHIAASMSSSSVLANIDRGSMQLTQQLFTMSGTSQAAAVTTGVVALMLQRDPSLTPDQVKCRLMATARPAVRSDGSLAYSVFQQGAGLINAKAAAASYAHDCANLGLDINADLANVMHFGGPANQDAAGNYYVMDMAGSAWGDPLAGDGFSWSQGYPYGQGFVWSAGQASRQGYAWSKGVPWSSTTSKQGYAWSKGNVSRSGYAWSKGVQWWSEPHAPAAGSSPASITPWVPNE